MAHTEIDLVKNCLPQNIWSMIGVHVRQGQRIYTTRAIRWIGSILINEQACINLHVWCPQTCSKEKHLPHVLPHDNHDYIQETQLQINKMVLHYRQLMGSAILNNS